MSDEKKRVPKLRFPGFTEEWEHRKLGDICSIITKGTTPKDKSGIGEVNFIKVENINLDNGEITGVSQITMEEHEGYLKRSRLEEDDILFSIAGTLGRVSVVKSSVLPANTNQALAIIRTKEGSIPYISTVLKGRAVEEFIRKNPTIGAQPNLSLEQVGNLEIPFPDEREQEKIGSYFQSLNNLITLHQCRLKHWEEMKKGLLQQMFPKKGETCPQIRFPEFNDDWEQRKLRDEAIEMLAGGDIDKSKIVENGKYPIYANALTNDGIVGYYDDYYRVKAPAVTVTGRGDVGHAQARTVDFTPVVRLLTIRSEHDAYFLENAINNHGVVVESTGVPQLTVPQLGNYMIQFPKTIEEETKIGEYFRNLDNLITLHQRKLEHLQKLKKGLLQQMFI